jgi:cell division septation protein DedD
MEYLMKNVFLSLILLTLATCIPIFSQTTDIQVEQYITMIDQGNTEKALTESSDLISSNPHHPGILFLQGRLSSDGTEALRYYQTILDNFPKNQWADDALYQTYQYYYAIGLYRTANLKLDQLKKQYPDSPYLNMKSSEQTTIEKKDEEVPKNIPLTVETPKPATLQTPAPQTPSLPASSPETKTTATLNYAIQVGAFSTLKNAEKQKTYFEELEYQVEITNKVRSGRSLFLVWVGTYPNAEEAVRVSFEIKKKYNIESIIVQR